MDFRKRFLIAPGTSLKLRKIDPACKGDHETPEAAAADIARNRTRLSRCQSLLYAGKEHAVLIILQALDAGGKDGAINHVFAAFNPQGAKVAAFKEPTPLERAHDFLWRIHPHAPAKGEITIFNRSHYEDVLVVRVHELIDKAAWETRYDRIRDFEKELAQSGTTILKFFLHISKEEQLARFAQRLDDPDRNWKISETDYSERALWDDYMTAYEDALSATSTHRAPWYVIPANHKWFRNLAVSQIVADTLEDLKMAWPKPTVDLADIKRKYHAAVTAEKNEKKAAG